MIRPMKGHAVGWALALGVAFGPGLAGCDDDPGKANFEYMPDMVGSAAYDSFDPNPNTPDGRTLMKPPVGSIPRGYQPFHYGPGDAEAARAGRELTNPLPDVEPVRARGAVAFARWCSPCHGTEGLGDGLVARKFPRPPSLVAEHARGLPEGRIFHIITFGQGVMPAYGQQVSASDRWKIVRHVKQLGVAGTPAGGATPKPAAPATPPAVPSVSEAPKVPAPPAVPAAPSGGSR